MNFTVEFYYTSDGNSPIEEFLSSLDIKMRAKIVSLMEEKELPLECRIANILMMVFLSLDANWEAT